MSSLNRIELIGYVSEKNELRVIPNGSKVIDLNVMVKNSIINNEGNEQEITSYHNVTFWRGLADVVSNYTNKGSQIYVSGRMQVQEYEDKEGNKKTKSVITADDLILLSGKEEKYRPDTFKNLTSGLNKAEIIGNITNDLNIRQTGNGKNVLSFSVATNRKWKDQDGNQKEEVAYHNVVVWDDYAKDLSNFAKKGSKVYISGKLQTRSWQTPDGQKKYTYEITADNAKVLGYLDNDNPKEKNDFKPSEAEIDYSSDVRPEDLPF